MDASVRHPRVVFACKGALDFPLSRPKHYGNDRNGNDEFDWQKIELFLATNIL
jgi:hypothetical protein